MVKIAKFGGTSVATAEQLKKVRDIVLSDDERRVIIPSAPGKAHKDDTKVTDLLYLAHEMAEKKQPLDQIWERITERFESIIRDLNLNFSVVNELNAAREKIEAGASTSYVASRGEAIHGRIVAALLDAEYIDAVEVIRFGTASRLDPHSYNLICERCADENVRYVIPGFYGQNTSGEVQTFSRGGSDVTGALAAAALQASVYENWTDVSGFCMTDPRIVPEARGIREITYRELRELSYMGAGVLHEEAVFPVRDLEIPINIRNTNEPEHPGTLIVADRDPGTEPVVGIAGRKGFAIFLIEKALMNGEVGFGRRVLDVFERLGIAYEHMPTGIDTMSIVVDERFINDKIDVIMEDLQAVHPDNVELIGGLALIATVGKGMNRRIGTAAGLFAALAEAEVNIRMIDQGSSEQNIIVGVEDADLPKAITAIYSKFC